MRCGRLDLVEDGPGLESAGKPFWKCGKQYLTRWSLRSMGHFESRGSSDVWVLQARFPPLHYQNSNS